MTHEERLDRLERLLKLCIRAGRRRLRVLDEKITILIDSQIRFDDRLGELREIIRANSLETDRRFQETERRFKETDLKFQETARRFNETDLKFRETDRMFKETDRKFQETDRQFQEMVQMFKERDLKFEQRLDRLTTKIENA